MTTIDRIEERQAEDTIEAIQKSPKFKRMMNNMTEVVETINRQEEQKELHRKALQNARQKKHRDNQTPEQRKARLKSDAEGHAKIRENETIEQKLTRLAKQARYQTRSKEKETPEQKKCRRIKEAEWHKKKIANETTEETAKRLDYQACYQCKRLKKK